jgi:zinc protease
MDRPPPGRLRLPKAPSIVEDSLGGRLYALAVRRRSVPLVQVRLSVRVSAGHIRKSAGPTVLAESLLAGTDQHDRQDLAEAIERLGGRMVASQGEDRFLLSASVLAENLDELLRLFAEVLHEAAYPSEEVRTDRERLANETLIALSQPDVIADEALRRRLYGRHPYAAEIPRPGALRRVSAGQLRRLHPDLLDPASAVLVLVGDVEPRRALASAS